TRLGQRQSGVNHQIITRTHLNGKRRPGQPHIGSQRADTPMQSTTTTIHIRKNRGLKDSGLVYDSSGDTFEVFIDIGLAHTGTFQELSILKKDTAVLSRASQERSTSGNA